MAIEFRCQQCQRLLRTSDDTAGKQAKCPQCGAIVPIPPAAGGPSAGGAPVGEAGGSPPAVPPADSPFAAVPPAGRPGGADQEWNPYSAPASLDAPPSAAAAAPGQLVHTRIDIGGVLSRAWQIYQGQMAICIGVFLVTMILQIMANYAVNILVTVVVVAIQASGADQAVAMAGAVFMQIAGTVGVVVFQTWLTLGLIVFFLKIARGQAAGFGDVFSAAPYLVRGVLTGLLLALIGLGVIVPCALPALITGAVTQNEEATAGVAIAGGLVAAVAMLVIWLALSQYQYLIVDRNAGVMESLGLSRMYTAGNRLAIFVILLAIGLLNLAGVLACCVGVVFTAPYGMLTLAVAYLSMTGQPTAEAAGALR